MESPVVVMEANEFAAWLDKEAKSIPTDPVERGRRWSTQFGCVACHSLDGKAGIGPSWKGVYGREEEMTTGQKLKVDDAYIRESIRTPSAKLVKGFTTPMPVLTLSDAQIADLIEYLKTLK
jgi:cytochrome c oxidase subunit 2